MTIVRIRNWREFPYEPISVSIAGARVDRRPDGPDRGARAHVHPFGLRVDVRRPAPHGARVVVGGQLGGDAAADLRQPGHALDPDVRRARTGDVSVVPHHQDVTRRRSVDLSRLLAAQWSDAELDLL